MDFKSFMLFLAPFVFGFAIGHAAVCLLTASASVYTFPIIALGIGAFVFWKLARK